jgi:hypothetical protein
MHFEEQTNTIQAKPVIEAERNLMISRRDILKVAWTAPVVMAVSPPLTVLAGSGPGPEKPPPVPPGWDKSSIKVTAVGCDGNFAIFRITNVGDGDMAGPSQWRAYQDNRRNLTLVDSGFFTLDSGESEEIRILSQGVKIRLIADQRSGHPGRSEPQDDIICGAP